MSASEDLQARLLAMEQEHTRLRERESAREAAESSFFEKVAPVLAVLGRQSLRVPGLDDGEHAAATAASPALAGRRLDEAAEVLAEAARHLVGTAFGTSERPRGEEELSARIRRLEADLRHADAERARLLCGFGPNQAAAQLPPSSSSTGSGPPMRHGGSEDGTGRGFDQGSFFYKPAQDDPVDCLLAASLLRQGTTRSCHVSPGFERLSPGLYRYGGARGLRLLCRDGGHGTLLLRHAAEGGAEAELDVQTFVEAHAVLASATAS